MKFHGSKNVCMLITDVCNLKCHLKIFIYFYTVNLFDTAFSFAYFVFLFILCVYVFVLYHLIFRLCSVHVLFSLLDLENVNSSLSSLRELIINKLALFEPPSISYHSYFYIIHAFTSLRKRSAAT